MKKYNIKSLFVSYSLATLLKKVKFNYPCLAWYDNDTQEFNMLGQGDIDSPSDYIHTTAFVPEITQAPTYQQVIDWLRNEHKIEIFLGNDGGVEFYCYRIFIVERNKPPVKNEIGRLVPYNYEIGALADYYEALNEGIEYCLEYILK